MEAEFINLTEENLAGEHLCCIIRSKKPHPGVEAKRQWLSERLREGHVFRKLKEKKGMVCPMEMVQVALLIALAIAVGLIFKTEVTEFVNKTFENLNG